MAISFEDACGLTLEKIECGGYLVTRRSLRAGDCESRLFACTDIGEALNFMRGRLVEPQLDDGETEK